jgi:hypothetical protein
MIVTRDEDNGQEKRISIIIGGVPQAQGAIPILRVR